METISIGQWLLEISNRLNIEDYSKKTPYFINIDETSIYYESVQALVEWGVIDTNSSINTEENLNREFVAYTLSNLFDDDINAISIKDSSKSKYPKHVEKSVALGIMQLDSRECFNPKKVIDKNEALLILDKVVNNLDKKVYEDSFYNLNWKDDLVIVEEEPIDYDEDLSVAYYPKDTKINKGDILKFNNNDELETVKKAEDIVENEDLLEIKLSDPKIDDLYDEIDIQDTVDINFDTAIFENIESNEVDFDKVEIEENYEIIDFVNLSNNKKQSNSFEINGFKVKYFTNGGTLKVTLNKTNTNGSIIYGEASLFGVRPTFKWKTNNGNIDNAYFRIDFKTNSSLGLKKENYKNQFSDLSTISSNDFINSLKKSFKDKNDILDTIIPVCKIKIPLANAPSFTIVMQLQIEIYTSGRIELSLSNTHSIGMEIKNNKLRTISDHDYNADFIVKASGNLLMGVYSGLNLFEITLMDVGLSGGVKTHLQSIVHLYDSDGKVNSSKSELPTDLLDDMSKENKEIKVCGDLKGYWVLDATINSSKSVANKIGLYKKINILNEKNASLIPGLNKHIENWQFVEKCTVNDRYYALNKYLNLDSEKIIIDKYSKVLDINDSYSIKVLNVPEGYSKNQLIFTSNDSKIASVDKNGNVSANSKGNTIITIKTNDNKHEIKFHILVR